MKKLILGITLIVGIGLCAKSRPESDMAFINSNASTETNIDIIYKYFENTKKLPCQLQKDKAGKSFINFFMRALNTPAIDSTLCIFSFSTTVKEQVVYINLKYENNLDIFIHNSCYYYFNNWLVYCWST